MATSVKNIICAKNSIAMKTGRRAFELKNHEIANAIAITPQQKDPTSKRLAVVGLGRLLVATWLIRIGTKATSIVDAIKMADIPGSITTPPKLTLHYIFRKAEIIF